MDYSVTRKLYIVSFVAETRDGETFSGELPLTSIRNIEQQVKHYHDTVKRVTAFTAEQVVCAMPVQEFVQGSTITKIGE